MYVHIGQATMHFRKKSVEDNNYEFGIRLTNVQTIQFFD